MGGHLIPKEDISNIYMEQRSEFKSSQEGIAFFGVLLCISRKLDVHYIHKDAAKKTITVVPNSGGELV